MARAWHLMSRPQGLPTADNFALKDIALPPLGDGMVRVRNRWLSVDPYMRGRMNDVKSYVPPFQIDAPMDGRRGRRSGREPATRRCSPATWCCTWPAGATRRSSRRPHFNKLPAIPGVEPQAFLGNLGLTGGTAYFGLLEAASAKAGDIVFVSAAAGAVGSAVVQIAKAKGMTVIGSARRRRQMRLRPLARRRRGDRLQGAGRCSRALAAAAPKGIDVYFDNVGGDHLDAAFALARKNARFAICGMIEGYNAAEPMCFSYIMRVIAMRIRLQGFIYTDYHAPPGRVLPRHGRAGSPAARSRRATRWWRGWSRRPTPSSACSPAPTPARCSSSYERRRSPLTGIDHVVLLVGDMERATAFYTDVIGCIGRQ